MTKPLPAALVRKAVFQLDSFGFPRWRHDFMPAPEAEALALASGADHVALTYGEYLARQDPDDESKGREARRIARNRGESVAPLVVPSCVISGVVAGHTRESAAACLAAKGWRVTSALTGQTRAMIIGDKPGASKLARARALGVEVIQWESVA